ncbi:beta-1,3-galactosyltransferase 2-like, partial [Pseudophryne corroboree]|uniref:beta-1,3-galactosyltransferase 2-like n=1 Tax=Pseudophryne corroboree TaxID=495146 RepID=UPI0030814AC6
KNNYLKLYNPYLVNSLNGSTSSSITTTVVPETISSEECPKIPQRYKYIINEPNKCNEHVPFLILLVTVERWQQQARQAIRQTWGKEDFITGVKILRLYLLGSDTINGELALLSESEEYHDIIQQYYFDTYNNLTIKVLMGLSWVVMYCPQAMYVMKTDSDMIINTEYLVNKLLKPDQPLRMNYFTGYLMTNAQPIRDRNSKWYMPPDVYPENQYPPFCSGTGYVFSGDLAQKIVNISPIIRWLHLEDVYIGLCLDKLGVQPVVPPKITDFNAWRVMYTDCGYNQIVTSHMWSPGEIIFYWNMLQKKKHLCV